MIEQFKSFLRTHTITTHSIVAAFTTLCMLYAAVPAFHDLVVNAYAATPPWFHQTILAGAGIWAFYQGAGEPKKPQQQQ